MRLRLLTDFAVRLTAADGVANATEAQAQRGISQLRDGVMPDDMIGEMIEESKSQMRRRFDFANGTR